MALESERKVKMPEADKAIVKIRSDIEQDAEGFLRNLLQGTASLGPLSGADREDAMLTILASEKPDSELMDNFGEACLTILNDYHHKLDLGFIEGIRNEDIAFSRIDTLLRIIYLIFPPKTIYNFYYGQTKWSKFFDRYSYRINLAQSYRNIIRKRDRQLGKEVRWELK